MRLRLIGNSWAIAGLLNGSLFSCAAIASTTPAIAMQENQNTTMVQHHSIFTFSSVTQLPNIQEKSQSVTAAEVNGTWKSRFGTFKILALGEQKLQVEFSGVYVYNLADGSPMANVGTGDGIATIAGRKATFQPQGAKDDCLITMEFGRREMVVQQQGICGFGLNVTATGTYRKVNAAKPKFLN